MSYNVVAFRNKNQLFVNTDLTKIFVWANRFEPGTFNYNNSAGDDVSIPEGVILGRILTTQKLVMWDNGASDGSQYPVGILVQGVFIEYGEDYEGTVQICTAGDVASEKIVLPDGVTFSTEVNGTGRSLRDFLSSVSGGIRLPEADQHTSFDNS